MSAPTQKQPFTPTQEQQQAINLAKTNQNMRLLAFAGAGKTSTLYLIADALKQQNKRGLYLSFNKAIAREAKKKMPSNVDARTFHSMAYKGTPWQITRRLHITESAKDFITTHQLADINGIVLSVPAENGNGFKTTTRNIEAFRLRSLIIESIKLFCGSEHTAFSINHVLLALDKYEPFIAEHHKQLIAEKIFPIAAKLVKDYFSTSGIYPLNNLHDVYLKYWALTEPVIHTDFILFDEAQDADPLMRQILNKQKCQVIYVGDPYQQIYSWRGAINAMANVEGHTSYLTQSFRFGQALADKAQKVLDYLGSPVAIRGTEKETVVDTTTYQYQADFDAYICRTNAGIIEAAFWHIKQGKKFQILGMDYKELIDIIVGLDELGTLSKTYHPLLKDFSSLSDVDAYIDATPGEMAISPYRRLHRTYGCNEILQMIDLLKNTDSKSANIVGVTAHSAKGMEYSRICLGEDFEKVFFDYDQENKLIPKRGVSEEEFRLLYVAMTRGKDKVYLRNVNNILEKLPVFEAMKHEKSKVVETPVVQVDTTAPAITAKLTKKHADIEHLDY